MNVRMRAGVGTGAILLALARFSAETRCRLLGCLELVVLGRDAFGGVFFTSTLGILSETRRCSELGAELRLLSLPAVKFNLLCWLIPNFEATKCALLDVTAV